MGKRDLWSFVAGRFASNKVSKGRRSLCVVSLGVPVELRWGVR